MDKHAGQLRHDPAVRDPMRISYNAASHSAMLPAGWLLTRGHVATGRGTFAYRVALAPLT